ncbi:MAG: hypothetical protein Q8L78_04285 [Coxiellaceae bacterium]|nr:hypothetical protein [Coxiellaceae bacterium]
MRPTTKIAQGYFESAAAFAARKAAAVKAAHEFQTTQAITAKKEVALRQQLADLYKEEKKLFAKMELAQEAKPHRVAVSYRKGTGDFVKSQYKLAQKDLIEHLATDRKALEEKIVAARRALDAVVHNHAKNRIVQPDVEQLIAAKAARAGFFAQKRRDKDAKEAVMLDQVLPQL